MAFSATATSRLNREALAAIVVSPNGPIAQDLLRRGIRVQSQARRNLGGGPTGPRRIDTGRLRQSISVDLRTYRGRPAVRIGTNVHYARYVHDGTGLYGPRRRLIRPTTKRVLRWRAGGGFVYARYTRGMRANPFLSSALDAAIGTR